MAEEQEQQTRTVMIDGVEYKLGDLSENARQQLVNLRVAECVSGFGKPYKIGGGFRHTNTFLRSTAMSFSLQVVN
ncbi:hypothetical protein HH1059_12390 [Halorhodospira halochloris]|uniref:Uncharacterized protein n=1 Tax=Halorhodospira halochloris TaxID=1052 RepID=A0A110B563_HALHR|nr:hypothetical protein [Halorhodospira halochloris]MBK1652959.1 hypothetical protein [Halorhodospira halochloris]BAU57938.1 hypothetical protein HH1059_12390 [Halorhodospira halochloris]